MQRAALGYLGDSVTVLGLHSQRLRKIPDTNGQHAKDADAPASAGAFRLCVYGFGIISKTNGRAVSAMRHSTVSRNSQCRPLSALRHSSRSGAVG